MMISTKLEALRQLFAQHARVALLAQRGALDVAQHRLAQHHLAKLYAKTYRHNYRHVVWLDASNPFALRLSCLQADALPGFLPDSQQPDATSSLQSWLQQQDHLLLIIEQASDPSLLADMQDHAHHLLFCSALPSWPVDAPHTALLHLNRMPCKQINKQLKLGRKNERALSTAASALLGILQCFGPNHLPQQLVTQDEQHLPLLQQLLTHQFCQVCEWRDASGQQWSTLRCGAGQTKPTAQQLVQAGLILQAALQDMQLPAALLPLFAALLEHLLAYNSLPPAQAAALLQQLEPHYLEQPEHSAKLLQRALALRQQCAPDLALLACQNLLAQNLKQQGQMELAQQLLCHTLELATDLLGPQAPQSCIYLSNLARLLAARGQHLAAVELEQQALHGLRRTLGDADPQTLTVMHNLAQSLQHLPADEQSQARLQELVEIHLRLFGECDLRSQALMDLLAGNLFQQHKLKLAAHWAQRVLDARAQLFGLEHTETSIAAYELLCLRLELQQPQQASAILQTYLAWLALANPQQLSEPQSQIQQLLQTIQTSQHTEANASFTGEKSAACLLH